MKTLKTLFILFCLFIFISTVWSQSEIKKPIITDDYEIKTTPVKDQENSNVCWSYAAVSFLESEILRKGFSEVDLSEMYYVRQMYLQRGMDYIRYRGNLNFGNGGHAHDVINQINEFGIIPQEFYMGNDYNPEYMDLFELDSILYYFIKDVAENNKENWINSYQSIIESYLGKVPKKFEFNGKTYTPVEFFQSFNINTNDYIELTSYNHKPFYKSFVLEIPDNWSHNNYLNVPLDDFISIMENSIKNGYSFIWNGDVLNEGFFYYDNICIIPDSSGLGAEKNITQDYRQKRFDEFTVQDEHLVHVIGLAHDDEGKLYFKSKNSWGAADMYFGGYQYMSEEYLKLFTVSMMIHKDAIPKEIKEKLGWK